MSSEKEAREWDVPTEDAGGSNVQRLTEGSLLAGRYRILDLLGAGGMGMVYRAEDQELGLTVAIKVLRSDLAQDWLWIGRFKQELLLARQVSHTNVVRIHDIGSDEGVAFLTMDFVPGRSLGDLIAEEKRLPPHRAAEIARQIALALDAAHRAGVVHRDIKPSNVLVDESGSHLRIAITDFGIARSVSDSGLTLPGAVLGTPGYLSPEQARGDALDGRSDLYTLGILLYEMLTGELPFAAPTDAGRPARRMRRTPWSLRWPDDVPSRLRTIVQRLLARDPSQRLQSAAQAARELELDRAAATRRTWRWTLLGSACLLVLAILLGVFLARSRPPRLGPKVGAAVAAVPSVALLPLTDDTGRQDLAWIATGMPEMLTTSLAESPELRVLDSPRVYRTLEDLKLPRGPLLENDSRRLATLLDADHLVSGRVSVMDGRLRIDLSVLAADLPGLPAASLHAEANEGEAFRLVEQLGGILRQRLSVPADVTMEPAPSRSPAALADFSRGLESLRRGDALAAVPLLENAVASDPRYVAAWVQLARALQALGRGEEAREAAQSAVKALGPGESRTAWQARAIEAQLLGRPARAQAILAQLLARYPRDVEARVELAEAYGAQGLLDRAVASLKEAVSQAPHHPRAWFLLGKFSILAGDSRHAVDEYLVRALVVQNQLGSEQGRADVLNAFGVAYRNLGEMEKAAESYEAAAIVRKRIGDLRGYATSQRNLAQLETMRGEQEAARARLEEALAILQTLSDSTGVADLYNDFGALAEQGGDYEEALQRYQQSLRLRRDLGNDLDLSESFGNVGYACYLLGRYDDALVYWREGLDLAERGSDPGGVVKATQNLGQLELARGDWDEAVKSFLTALDTSRKIGMKETVPVSLGHLGRLAQYQGRPAAALSSYEEALKVLREIDDQRGLAEFNLAAAETELELGMLAAADKRLLSAREALGRLENREQQAEHDRLLGELLAVKGQRTAAAAALRQAVAGAEESHSVAGLLAARLSAADLLGGKDGLAELERLRVQAETLGNARLRLHAAESVARAALASGDLGKAEAAARGGLELAAECGGYAGAYRLHRLLAAALERSGKKAESLAERHLAAAEIARLSQNLPLELRRFFDRMLEAQNEIEQIRVDGRAGRGTFPPKG